jgi:hypothetical protein
MFPRTKVFTSLYDFIKYARFIAVYPTVRTRAQALCPALVLDVF